MEGDGIFPHSPTLEEVREAVADTEEFKFSKYTEDDGSELIFYNYRFCTPRTFPPVSEAADPRQKRLFLIRRECRGLVYRVRPDGTSELVARMFHKFFVSSHLPQRRARLTFSLSLFFFSLSFRRMSESGRIPMNLSWIFRGHTICLSSTTDLLWLRCSLVSSAKFDGQPSRG